MIKALRRVAFQVAHNWESVVTNKDLETIAKNNAGDVRCAANCLRFLMLKKTSRSHREAAEALSEPPYAETLGRDCSVALFHAVGKMVYNKREHPFSSFFLSFFLSFLISRPFDYL